MFQMNIAVLLMQACVFRWCGGIQTTSTTEEVSSFPVLFLLNFPPVDDTLVWIILNKRLNFGDELIHAVLDCPGSRRVAVFCLLQIGSEVFDTQMMVVDRSVTDICFEGTSILYVNFFFNKYVCYFPFRRVLFLTAAVYILLCFCCAAVKMQFLSLSWGWRCGAAPWRTTWRWSTRQRNWPRSSAARLGGALGRSSAPCWTLQTPTPFCSTTPSLRMSALITK